MRSISSRVGREVEEAIKKRFHIYLPSYLRLSSPGYRTLSGIWSGSVILRRLLWLSELRCEVEFKSKGNKKQFEHQQQVLDCLTEAQHSLASSRYEKAKKAIEEGINLTYKRINY